MNVQNMMTQGSLEKTDIPTDLAISGSGFFMVEDTSSGTMMYTRAGQFSLDKEGYVVNQQGHKLQGYNIDDKGNIVQISTDLRLLTQQTDATATSEVKWSINLNAEDKKKHLASKPIDPNDQDTWNYLNTTRTYDSLGVAHDLSLFYQRLEPGSYPGPFPAGVDGSKTSTWKVSTFENIDGKFSSANITAPNTYYLHFDSDGHLVGSSTGLAASGDRYQSSAVVTNINSDVSDRVGETFSYTGASGTGEQKIISSVTLDLSGIAGTEDVTIGSDLYANVANRNDLIDRINQSATGYRARPGTGANQVIIEGNGSSPNKVEITDDPSNNITVTNTTMSNVIDTIDNGARASATIGFPTVPLTSAVTITIGGNAYNLGVGSNQAAIAAALNADPNVSATAIGNGSILIQANNIGAAGNNITLTSSNNSVGKVSDAKLVGGVDDNSVTLVDAATIASGKGVALDLRRTDTGSAATITLGSNNTMGDSLSLDFDTWSQTSYANAGQVSSGAEAKGEQTLTFNWLSASGSTEPQEIKMDFSPTGASASTQSAGKSETFYLHQDGSTRGALQSLDISPEGVITGKFSNGILKVLGQVSLTNFANPEALKREGNNLWSQTINSGEPVTNTPNSGGLGSLKSGHLEQSNVDLAGEFVKMINYQRAYQANSRTISTTDEMLQELLNLKR